MKVTATLSKREAEMTERIAWGSSYKEVAAKLFVSNRTVENTIRSVFKKTGTKKVNELSAWYFCVKYKIPFTDSPLLIIILLLTLAAGILEGITLTNLFIFQAATL